MVLTKDGCSVACSVYVEREISGLEDSLPAHGRVTLRYIQYINRINYNNQNRRNNLFMAHTCIYVKKIQV